MALSGTEFLAEVKKLIDEKRFRNHPLWRDIAAGKASRKEVQQLHLNFLHLAIDNHHIFAPLLENCPYPEVLKGLAENSYEEATGKLSGAGEGHSALALRLLKALGFTEEEIKNRNPLPASLAARLYLEAAPRRSFVEGMSAVALAAEDQIPGAAAEMAEALKKHYGLKNKDVDFWTIHEEADKEHGEYGEKVLVQCFTTDEDQEAARRGVRRMRDLFWAMMDEVREGARMARAA